MFLGEVMPANTGWWLCPPYDFCLSAAHIALIPLCKRLRVASSPVLTVQGCGFLAQYKYSSELPHRRMTHVLHHWDVMEGLLLTGRNVSFAFRGLSL